jgi:hypothetical protein
MRRLSILGLLLGLSAQAAPLRRLAVVVGANHGPSGRATLRYSYSDADQFAAMLTEVGQFAPEDVHVLRDPDPQAILAELDRDLAALGRGGESMLLFYYSGHADTVALYPDGKPLPFAQLRARLESQAATVRIGIIDACSGGGWTGTKGIYPSAPFVIDVPLQLTSEGSVLIASSSGVERAHESESVYGSFFTHHLVAALRGAADQHGGVVTLNDAFTYARERTIRDSAAVADPQHPSFSMNLRGRSDLPMTQVASSKTVMELTETEGPLQLIHLGTGLVVMEVPAGNRVIQLSVPSGRYLLRRQREGGNYSRELVVEPDHELKVDEAALTLMPYPGQAAKGIEPTEAEWPIALNDRPLALPARMVEFGAGVAVHDNTTGVPLADQQALPLHDPIVQTGFAPLLRYGATDRLTLTLALDGNCGHFACTSVGVNTAGLYQLTSGFLEIGLLGSVGLESNQQSPWSGGVTARVGRGHLFAFQATAAFQHTLQAAEFSNVWEFAGVVVVQPFQRVSFDLGSDFLWASKLAVDMPLTVGGTVTIGSRVDLHAQFTADNVFVGGHNNWLTGAKDFQLLVNLRL